MPSLRTPRLELVAATDALLRAAIEGVRQVDSSLRSALDAEVPATWPPDGIDEGSLEWLRASLASRVPARQWASYFVVLCLERRRVLVGTAGFKGPPSASGDVELGYSIVQEFQRRGFATEAVLALVDHAFSDPSVRSVSAETALDGIASQGVLRKCRFDGPFPGSEHATVRYRQMKRDCVGAGAVDERS